MSRPYGGGDRGGGRGSRRKGGRHEFFSGSSATYSDSLPRKLGEEADAVGAVSSKMGNMQLLTRSRDRHESTSTRRPADEHGSSSATTNVAPLSPIAPIGIKQRKQPTPTVYTRANEAMSPRPTIENTTANLGMKSMTDAIRLVNDAGEFIESISEHLSDTSTNFHVIAAIGPQGVGKSTVLSMIGGNDSQDMYRYHLFRPASREAVESSRHQTLKIHVCVTKARHILLDCQATNSAAILEETLRYSRSHKADDRPEFAYHLETLQILAYILQVSHTVLLCSDFFIDIEVAKMLRVAELLRANTTQMNLQGIGMPIVNLERKVNLIFIHTRARLPDFRGDLLQDRREMLRRLFADSSRIYIPTDDDFVIVPLAEIKPRKDSVVGSRTQAHVHDKKTFELDEIVDFDTGMRKFRLMLTRLYKDPFLETTNGAKFTEKNWFSLARAIWRDNTFHACVSEYARFM